MRRVLFIASHLCSGSDSLFNMLDSHPRIQGHRMGISYDGPQSLVALTSQPHKLENSSAVYMDEMLFNYNISSKPLYVEAHYVFLIRSPRDTINEIAATKNYHPNSAWAYYRFRLHRLRSIAHKAKGAVVLTYEDLVKGQGLELIGDYLGLKEPFTYRPVARNPYPDAYDNISHMRVAEEAYESTLYALRNLGLRHTKMDAGLVPVPGTELDLVGHEPFALEDVGS
jgi:hypothetical protein